MNPLPLFSPPLVSAVALFFCAVIARADRPGQFVEGAVRITAITPECVRIEFNPSEKFVDAPSYFAVNRERIDAEARITRDADRVVMDTGAISLAYTPDGKPPGPDNLQATIRQGNSTFQWKPGMPNAKNLGGAAPTLDEWTGAKKLPDGLLSRDGWFLLDDSKTALLTADWAKSRPDGAGTDWYLFGYGTDYKGALKSLTAIGGAVPLPRRALFGAWYSRYWNYTSDDYRHIVQEYAQHDYPLDVIVMDMDWHLTDVPGVQRGYGNLVWTGYTWDRSLLPDAEELLKWFHSQGLAVNAANARSQVPSAAIR